MLRDFQSMKIEQGAGIAVDVPDPGASARVR